MNRITIMLDGTIESKLRSIQAKTIRDTNRTFSFSAVVNQVLRKGLK